MFIVFLFDNKLNIYIYVLYTIMQVIIEKNDTNNGGAHVIPNS